MAHETDRARLTLLDRFQIWKDPIQGVAIVQARERLKMFGYDGAQPGTKRGRSGGRGKNASSENWRSNRDRVAMMWDARDVVRNFGILRGIVARIVQYTADRVQYVAETGEEEMDSLYQDYFHNWCQGADITGRHRLGQLVWLMFWSMLVDGDHGWNLIEVESGGERALKVQAIEGDRIGDPSDTSTTDPKYISGIVVDDFGAPKEYKIFKRDRQGTRYDFEGMIPAEQFIHFFDPSRVDQYRGVTALATAIAPARDLYEIYRAEQLGAKWQIGHAGFIEDETIRDGGTSAWGEEGNGPAGGDTYDVQPGMIRRLQKGQKVQFAPGTNRPSGAFMALVEVMVREISSGTNFPYGFLYDMSAFSGHTGRVEIAQAMRGIRRYQNIIGEKLDAVRDVVLGRGIALGDLPPHPKWKSGHWGFGPTLTGDYGHDTTANLAMLNAGLISASDLVAETGKSFEDVVRRQASEVMFMQRIASETGVPIELMSNRLNAPTQALAAMNTPPPAPPSGMVEQGIDMKPLIELLKQVGEGVIDRESAIANVQLMYGVSRADAQAMVPEVSPTATAAGNSQMGKYGGKFGDSNRKVQKKA
jgi:capsid protein